MTGHLDHDHLLIQNIGTVRHGYCGVQGSGGREQYLGQRSHPGRVTLPAAGDIPVRLVGSSACTGGSAIAQ